MQDEIFIVILVILVLWLIYQSCYKCSPMDSFGMDNKPFEPDNTSIGNNPWDEIQYIKPTFRV